MIRPPFANNKVYHIYNRGVRRNEIFLSKKDYQRWEKLLYWSFTYNYSYSKYLYRVRQVKKGGKEQQQIIEELDQTRSFKTPPVQIFAYVEMPNHYHLILKQTNDSGIAKFMHKCQTSYSKYFNLLHGFKGAVIESKYQAILVNTDKQLLQLFRYIHNNPFSVSTIDRKNLLTYPWSSLPSYVMNTENSILFKQFMLRYFDNDVNKLWKFTIAEYDSSEIESIQSMTHDDDFGWYQKKKEQELEKYNKMIDRFNAY